MKTLITKLSFMIFMIFGFAVQAQANTCLENAEEMAANIQANTELQLRLRNLTLAALNMECVTEHKGVAKLSQNVVVAAHEAFLIQNKRTIFSAEVWSALNRLNFQVNRLVTFVEQEFIISKPEITEALDLLKRNDLTGQMAN